MTKRFFAFLGLCWCVVCCCPAMVLNESQKPIVNVTIQHSIFGKMGLISHKADIGRFDRYLSDMGLNPNKPKNVVDVLLWNCCEKGDDASLRKMVELGEENYQEWFSLKEIKEHYINIAKNRVGLDVLKVIAANGLGMSDNAWPLIHFPKSKKETGFIIYRPKCFFVKNTGNTWFTEKERYIQICEDPETLQFYNCILKTFEQPYEVDTTIKLAIGTIRWKNCVANLEYYANREEIDKSLQKRFNITEIFSQGCRDEKMLSNIFGDANNLWASYGIVFGEDGTFYYDTLNESAFFVEAGNRVRMGHAYYPEHEFVNFGCFQKFCEEFEKLYGFYSFYAKPEVRSLIDW